MAIVKLKAGLTGGFKGRMGNAVYSSVRGKLRTVRKVYEDSARSLLQIRWREVYKGVDWVWSEMSFEERNLWRPLARRKGESNYSVFMSVNLKAARAGLPVKVKP